jgi:endonuclease I
MRFIVFVFCLGFYLTSYSQELLKSKLSDSPADIPPGYYDGTENLTGAALKAVLHSIINNHTRRSYAQVWEDLKITDEDTNNTNNVILLYSGFSYPKSLNGGDPNDWNREHVWPSSHGFSDSDTAYTDIHHLRPTDVTVNGARGNLDFDNGGTENSEAPGNFADGDSWEPRDAVKGDVARMVFYMSTRYEQTGNYDLELVNYAGTSGPILGVESTLLQWHIDDPVDTYELNRHEKIYNIQGNRNPFIDHPEFVAKIWSDTGTTPPPTADSSFYISEVSDASAFNNEYLEIYNNTDQTVDLANVKIIRLNDAGNFDGFVFDFVGDGAGDTEILPYNFIVIARDASKAAFESGWSTTLPADVRFNEGHADLFFGTSTARRWALKVGGTANSNDGPLIDDTQTSVAGSGKRSYQNVVGSWITENTYANATPGELDAGQILPVTLTSMSIQSIDGYALLSWQTATEQNNLGFEILRASAISKNNFEVIGFISGNGTSNTTQHYTFADDEISISGEYFYKLKQIDLDGSYTFSEILTLNVAQPDETVLFQNKPNPFNPSTNIEFKIQSTQKVILDVFDIKGERIVTLVNKNLQPGTYKFYFDGSELSSGIYFYRLITDKIFVKKMNLIK